MTNRRYLNKIEFICDRQQRPEVPIRLDGFAIFSDNWITEHATQLINERTGEVHEILTVDYYINSEWDDVSLIQYGGAHMREVKRTAVKTATPLNPNDFYIAQ